MAGALFPLLNPKLSDALWFNVDKNGDDEEEINKAESEYEAWLESIRSKETIAPIGKNAAETIEEDDDEDEEAEESESNDEEDEIDVMMMDEHELPQDDPNFDF